MKDEFRAPRTKAKGAEGPSAKVAEITMKRRTALADYSESKRRRRLALPLLRRVQAFLAGSHWKIPTLE